MVVVFFAVFGFVLVAGAFLAVVVFFDVFAFEVVAVVFFVVLGFAIFITQPFYDFPLPF